MQLFSKKIASVSQSRCASPNTAASTAASPSQGEAVSYTSDPLEDFTTIKFLDRFVYKNPKLKGSDHGGSVMQVSLIHTVGGWVGG